MAFITRVAVETLAVSSSRSECIVSGSRFTVSTLMSSFLRVTSLRPETRGRGGGQLGCFLPASVVFSGPTSTGKDNCHTPGPSEALPAGGPGNGEGGLWPTGPILTAFATPVEEEHQGNEEEGEQDARADGGSSDDAHG